MLRWTVLIAVILAYAFLPPPAHFTNRTPQESKQDPARQQTENPTDAKGSLDTKPAEAKLAANTTLAAPAGNLDLLFRETSPRLGLIRYQDIFDLSSELQARGEPEAAKKLLAVVTATERDYESLFVRLMQVGQEQSLDAALRIHKRWTSEFPKSMLPRFFSAVFQYQAANKGELALRELARIEGREPEELKLPVRMLHSLIEMELQRRTPGCEDNPWSAKFLGVDGQYAIGGIAPKEAAKIPAGSADALAVIVRVLPHNGNLWALLGELLNASGDPKSALQCMRNANQLGYQPRIFREHYAMINKHQKEVERSAVAQISTAANPNSPEEQPVAPPQRYNILEHKDVLVVSIVGSLLLLGLVVLQVREWIRRGNTPPTKGPGA